LAYSGSAREDLQGLLIPLVEDVNIPMEVAGIAGLALGMIFVGTANAEITQSIVTALMERDEASLNVTQSRFLCLGLGLLYLGKQALADVTIETLKTLTHPIGKYAVITVDSCAYTGIH
jgi:26S proteasome regulatory subunit N1